MSPSEKRLFESLQKDVTDLHMYWKLYMQLYSKGPRRLRLLNKSGSLVFDVLQQLFRDEMTLAFCRLTDPAKTYGKENHSIPNLLTKIDGRSYPDLKRELSAIWDSLKAECQDFRKRRNRALAHSDLQTKLNPKSAPLAGFSKRKIEKALRLIRNLMNMCEYHFSSSETAYSMVLFPLGTDGDFLVTRLQRAAVYCQMEKSSELSRDRWNTGEYANA